MANNSDFEITNGQIKLPYNFNDEKYIIGIERKSDNTLMAGKTIIPIRDSKPSYILEITPKTYPTFYFKKSDSGECYELIKNEVFFNVNFIMDEIPLSTSDYEINVDWNEKYAITKTNLPKEVKLTLSETYHKINSGDTHYDILEQNNNYSDRINLTLIDNKNLLVYNTVLEIVFQKSYFEIISKYDSIDISERDDFITENKKNVITVDGYHNDNKIEKNDLELNFKNGDDIFTSLISTMKYADIVKGQNEFYLAHKELSKSEYEETPLYNCVVKDNNIYRKKNEEEILLVSGNTLYDGVDNKIIDSNGIIYSGTTILVDNSGNTILNTTVKIDNSGNTFYGNVKIIDKKENIINNSLINELTIDYKTDTQLVLSGTKLSPFTIEYNTGTKNYNIVHNNVEVITINDDNIIFNQPNYKLSATTEYSEESKTTTIKDLNITIDNQNYSWDINGDIKCEGYTVTNNNNDKNFYYCKDDGYIYFNEQKVKYVIDKDENYYNLENGKQIIIKDSEIFIDTTTLSILPEKNDILDKYNNIKVTKNTSYDLINKVEKDNNDKVISGIISGESFTNDDIFVTTAIDFENSKLYDTNERYISDISGQTIIIEGGLEVKTDKIYNGYEVVVSGITSSDEIGLTSNASKSNITLSGDTVYYRGKKAYSVNEGGFYFERKITEIFNSGFTLSNGLEISPLSVTQTTDLNSTNNSGSPDYSHGVIITHPENNFSVRVEFNSENNGLRFDYNENDDNNPGFSTDKNGNLIYGTFTIVSVNDNLLLNPRDPQNIKNRTTIVSYVHDENYGILNLQGEKINSEIMDKNDVYYSAHRIDEIKKNIPDLISYMFKQNKPHFDINIEATYINVINDVKNYTLIEGGNNNSSYEIKVEPQFITSNMITNGSTVIATIVNNNGDHIDNKTYESNNYKFTYLFDGSSDIKEVKEDTLKITLSTGVPIFNEIKFTLECGGKLVKQEIVEVLGENKLITSVEYVDVSNGNATYIIQPTTNAYYGTNITWKNNNDEVITGLTLTSADTKQIIYGYCNNIRVYEQTILPLKKGEQGEPGKDGEPGKKGKLLYPAGRWDSRTSYDGTDDEKTPFVLFNEEYYVLTSDQEIIGADYIPGGSSTAWTKMEQYEAIYTKLLVAENGVVGGSVYNGDYVFSKDGISGNTIVNNNDAYSGFNKNIVEKIFTGETINNQFIPNYLVDFSKGRAWFGGGNTIINNNGSISTNLLCEEIKEKELVNLGNIADNEFDIKNISFYGPPLYDDEYIHLYSGVTAMREYIHDLNCYIVDGPLEENATLQCSLAKVHFIEVKIKDESVVKPNVFYRGNIYIDPNCSQAKIFKFKYYNNNDYGLFFPYNGGIISYLFKWDGTYDADDNEIKKGKIVLIGDYDYITILQEDCVITDSGAMAMYTTLIENA